jgi:MFS transporter, ACS family, hexuronate transporter
MGEVQQPQDAELASSPQAAGSAWKWWLMGVLFLGTVLTYLDRQTLAVCKTKICDEFNLSNEQYGQLIAAFRWPYALMQLPAGMMADRLSLRMTYGLAVGLWSLAGAAAAFVFRFRGLSMARSVLGMGECFNWPCCSRVVANAFPPTDRSLASGIFNSGAAIGALIAPLLIGVLADTYGWRAAFGAIGGLGVVWLALWLAVTRRRSRCHDVVSGNWKLSARGTWAFSAIFLVVGIGLPVIVILFGPRLIAPVQVKCTELIQAWPILPWALGIGVGAGLLAGLGWSLVRWRRAAVGFWMLMIVTVTINPCWYFVGDWVFAYLQDSRQLSAMTARIVATLVFFVADLGNVISGGIIKHLTGRGWSLRAARSSVMFGVACAVAPVALITRVQSTALATVVLACAGAGIAAVIANYTACQQDLSFRNAGLISGVVGMAANVVSALANPQIGAHIDKTKSYEAIFVLLGLLPLLSVAAIVVFDSALHGRKTASKPAP